LQIVEIMDAKKIKTEEGIEENGNILEDGEKAEVIEEHMDEEKREAEKGEMDGADPMLDEGFNETKEESGERSASTMTMNDETTNVNEKHEGNAIIIPDVEREERMEDAERVGLADNQQIMLEDAREEGDPTNQMSVEEGKSLVINDEEPLRSSERRKDDKEKTMSVQKDKSEKNGMKETEEKAKDDSSVNANRRNSDASEASSAD
ncbi:hypothetical protein PMAYCL1PPCAC_32339, partial [Pristionchus mayeri]